MKLLSALTCVVQNAAGNSIIDADMIVVDAWGKHKNGRFTKKLDFLSGKTLDNEEFMAAISLLTVEEWVNKHNSVHVLREPSKTFR